MLVTHFSFFAQRDNVAPWRAPVGSDPFEQLSNPSLNCIIKIRKHINPTMSSVIIYTFSLLKTVYVVISIISRPPVIP